MLQPQHPWRAGGLGVMLRARLPVSHWGPHLIHSAQGHQDTPSQPMGQGFLPSPAGIGLQFAFQNICSGFVNLKTLRWHQQEMSRAEKPLPSFVPWLQPPELPLPKTISCPLSISGTRREGLGEGGMKETPGFRDVLLLRSCTPGLRHAQISEGEK